MNFYHTAESFDSFDEFETSEKNIINAMEETPPARKNESLESFSNLSAEERWNFSHKLKELQKIINSVQTEINPSVSKSNFTLQEVLEVLNIRRTMQKGFDK